MPQTSVQTSLVSYFGTTLLFFIPHMLLSHISYAGQSEAEADVETESDTYWSLLDRLMNPREYQPVLPTIDKHTAAELTENKQPVNSINNWLSTVYTVVKQ